MILYITFDGLLLPLGRSQVVRYLEGLADRGWPIAVLSLEREADLDDHVALAAMEERLAQRGIRWLRLRYRESGPAGIVQNIAEATTVALDFALDHDVSLVHARSYLAGAVALALHRTIGTGYVFDIRGYWIDERIADGRWFTNRPALAAARISERAMFHHAAAVVCLTEVSAGDVRSGRFGRPRPVTVIPTCVDTDLFTMEPPGALVPAELHDRLVVTYVGSIRAAYRVDDCFTLVRHVLEGRDDAHFLCLTAQEEVAAAMMESARIPPDRRTLTRVPFDDVPHWLRAADWGLMLSDTTFVKRASMPTKLAEYFATGVRPAVYGCNDDVTSWVHRSGSGIVLDACTPRGLRVAAAQICEIGRRPRQHDPVGERAREITMRHFSASSGVERYDQLYRELHR